MSELRVDSVKSKGGGAPNLPKGVTISGITTAVTLGATQIDVSNVNVSGVVTSGTLSGSLLSTGTPTLGLGVTINSSGLVISGVATAGIVSATTLYGDGTNITGVGATLAPLFYNPDVSDGSLEFTATGIGITFNQQIKAGTGNITLRLVGAAGTVVENFGVGSSVTISENKVSFTPTADLAGDTVYHINYPSGCFTNNEGTDYVGTAYTFNSRALRTELFVWGTNYLGIFGLNNTTLYSSPVQIPGTKWGPNSNQRGIQFHTGDGGEALSFMINTDGEMWTAGYNKWGRSGVPSIAINSQQSSPVQVPGTTWKFARANRHVTYASKTDGTLWSWGYAGEGGLGQNQGPGGGTNSKSSPVQIPGTTWVGTYDTLFGGTNQSVHAIKTDGTLWGWGANGGNGFVGNNTANPGYSSPAQIPGTSWSKVSELSATRTDGTLWVWGPGFQGDFANNRSGPTANPSGTGYQSSSPIQIPGTTWSTISSMGQTRISIKTDGTLWQWGVNDRGQLGQNSTVKYSSPVQVPGTTWSDARMGYKQAYAIKTDGTLWAWGQGHEGQLGQGNVINYSSPVQIPGTTWLSVSGGPNWGGGIKRS